MNMNEFVTWQSLGTYAGAVMMVTLITQFLKQTPLKTVRGYGYKIGENA